MVAFKSIVNAIIRLHLRVNFIDMFLRVGFVSTVVATIFFLSAAVKSQSLTRTVLGIFDGWVARPLQFPFHALIGCIFNNGTVEWICNGAIINNRFVVTQATCVSDCENFKIRVGTIVHSDMNVTEGIIGDYVTKPGKKPYFAPGYLSGYQEHDLALLETNSSIIYSKSVNQIFLPRYNRSVLAPNVNVVATGFGRFHEYNPWWEQQYLTLKVSDHSQCLPFFPYATNTNVCAKGSEYNRTLRGTLCEELGAPLVLKRNNRTLVGIYQYSVATYDAGGPEMFIAIEPYVRWIRKTARFDTLDSNIYLIT